MAPAIIIRACNESDITTLLHLSVDTFRETFEEFNTIENMRLYLETFSDGRIADELHEPGSIFYIAEENNKPVGYARIRLSKTPAALPERSLEIERLYARKTHIGKGVGKQLMNTCLEHAKQHGFDCVWLGVWEHNTRAIAFYQQYGFERFSEHIFMVGNDAQTDFLMQKKL